MKRLILLLISCGAVYAQQNALLLPWTPQQFTNTNGTVLANGKVCTYQAGTSTGLATYTDSTASVANNVPPNAILLDSTGRPTSGGIWLKSPLAYKITVLTAGSDNTCNTGVIIKTQDQVVTGSGAGLNVNNTFTGSNTFTNLNNCQYVNASQSLPAAIAAVSNPGCIVVATNYVMAGSSTVPAGVSLTIQESGGITTTGFTLTVNGPLIAPAAEIFFGTGTVVLGAGVTQARTIWFPGADESLRANACITAAITDGDVTCIGTGGVQTLSVQINDGNTSSNPFNLLIPSNANWGMTNSAAFTGGATNCGVLVYNNAALLGTWVPGQGQSSSISTMNASVNTRGIVCTNDSLGTQTNTFRIDGINISNQNGATLTDAALVLRACKDVSLVQNNLIVNPSSVGVHIGGTTANSACGPITLLNNWINGGNGAVNNTTAQPLLINGSTTGGVTSGVTIVGGTIQQPGSGQNAIIIDGSTNFSVANVNFHGINGNGTLNAADAGTPYMRISHAGPTTWQGGIVNLTVAATAYCFRLENSANNLVVLNADCSHTNMVNNAVTNVNFTSSTSSIINYYSDQPNNSISGIVCPEQSSAPGFAVAGADVFYCDSVNHQMLGNYNNTGFSKVPLVGSNNIWTAGQFFNSGTLFPTSAGGTDVGGASNPFGNLWLGTAATNNFKFAPAATSAARVISIPDPGINTNLALNLTATSAAFATATTAGTCVQNTTAVTNAATTMVASASPVSTPGVGAVWSAFVSSAGNVTINECAVATSAGGSIAFNIRVTP